MKHHEIIPGRIYQGKWATLPRLVLKVEPEGRTTYCVVGAIVNHRIVPVFTGNEQTCLTRSFRKWIVFEAFGVEAAPYWRAIDEWLVARGLPWDVLPWSPEGRAANFR